VSSSLVSVRPRVIVSSRLPLWCLCVLAPSILFGLCSSLCRPSRPLWPLLVLAPSVLVSIRLAAWLLRWLGDLPAVDGVNPRCQLHVTVWNRFSPPRLEVCRERENKFLQSCRILSSHRPVKGSGLFTGLSQRWRSAKMNFDFRVPFSRSTASLRAGCYTQCCLRLMVRNSLIWVIAELTK